MKPLKGGLKLEARKEATLVIWTPVRPAPPGRVRVPLVQPDGSTAQPQVQEGDRVLVGQKIAETRGPSPIGLHASISGKVCAVSERIEILSDGKDELFPGVGRERPGWEALSAGALIQILQDAGIEWKAPSSVDTVILNGCESEPYLTSGHSLVMGRSVEILKAGEILCKILGARELIVALEDHAAEAAELFKSKIFFHTWSHARVEVFPGRYPQEDGRLLVRDLVGPGKTAFVENVAEAFAVYEAVVSQKPFYERIVTVGGECVAQPGNFWLRFGTLVRDGVKCAKGFLRGPEKIILGGPMRGTAIDDLETPVLKETRGILGLPREAARPESVEPCIRCGRCVDYCPVSISPVMITLAAEKDLFELAREYGAEFCIECGNCSYVCPAKRPMVELIQYVNAH